MNNITKILNRIIVSIFAFLSVKKIAVSVIHNQIPGPCQRAQPKAIYCLTEREMWYKEVVLCKYVEDQQQIQKYKNITKVVNKKRGKKIPSLKNFSGKYSICYTHSGPKGLQVDLWQPAHFF